MSLWTKSTASKILWHMFYSQCTLNITYLKGKKLIHPASIPHPQSLNATKYTKTIIRQVVFKAERQSFSSAFSIVAVTITA